MFLTPCLLLVLAWPAGAQRADYSPDERRVILSRYADCIAERHPKEASEWAGGEQLPTSGQRRAAADPSCLSGSLTRMTVPAVTMMYILADSLVRMALEGGPITDLNGIAPLRQPQVDVAAFTPKPDASTKKIAELEAGRKLAETRVYLARYGECVVRSNSAQAFALLQTEPASEEEAAAFQALSGAMASCLETGWAINVGKDHIRGVIALNYYRLANAPRVPAGASN